MAGQYLMSRLVMAESVDGSRVRISAVHGLEVVWRRNDSSPYEIL